MSRLTLSRAWRARLLRSAAVYTVLAAVWMLDRGGTPGHVHLADFGGGGNIWGGIGGAIGSVIQFFGANGSAFLAWTLSTLRAALVALANAIKNGLFLVAKYIGKFLLEMRGLWAHVIKPALAWMARKISLFEVWLKEKFAPIVRFLRDIKAHFDDFYKHYVKPIVDTIEFIRQINRVLEVFHITWLSKLDEVLQKIEQRVEEPFLWIREKFTWVENWIDRIVTLDGFFQRLTLVASLQKYAPDWLQHFWYRQTRSITPGSNQALRQATYESIDPVKLGRDVSEFYTHEGGPYAGLIREIVPEWRKAAGL
jgi:hypothetical protein